MHWACPITVWKQPCKNMARKTIHLTQQDLDRWNKAPLERRRIVFMVLDNEFNHGRVNPQPLWEASKIVLGRPDSRSANVDREIAGGGRYDNLVKLISGGKVNLPALGFGMGDVVLLELLKARQLLPKFDLGLEAFCLVEDEALRPASLRLIQELRTAGLRVDYSLVPAKPDKQFKRAQELKAARTVKLEKNDAGEVVVRIRDLRTRQESVAPLADAAKQLAPG